MIDPELSKRLDEIAAKADAAFQAAEKVRTYLFWTGVITVALFVLPLIGLMFVVPQFLAGYSSALEGLY